MADGLESGDLLKQPSSSGGFCRPPPYASCCFNLYMDMYVDQLWLNFVDPFGYNLCVVRHPGANIAYWNVRERLFLTIRTLGSASKWTTPFLLSF